MKKVMNKDEIDLFINNIIKVTNVLLNKCMNEKNSTIKFNIKVFYDELSSIYNDSIMYKNVDFNKMNEVFKRKRMIKELNRLVYRFEAIVQYLNKYGFPKEQIVGFSYKYDSKTENPDDLEIIVSTLDDELLRKNNDKLESSLRIR